MVEEIFALGDIHNNYNSVYGWYTKYEIENNFEIPEEKWVPKEEDKYYYPKPEYAELYSHTYFYNNNKYDEYRLENGLCFKTKEEAIACAKKMLEAIKK